MLSQLQTQITCSKGLGAVIGGKWVKVRTENPSVMGVLTRNNPARQPVMHRPTVSLPLIFGFRIGECLCEAPH